MILREVKKKHFKNFKRPVTPLSRLVWKEAQPEIKDINRSPGEFLFLGVLFNFKRDFNEVGRAMLIQEKTRMSKAVFTKLSL